MGDWSRRWRSKALVREISPRFTDALAHYFGNGPTDLAASELAHQQYVAALIDHGVEVKSLSGTPDHPDCCFIEDTAVVIDGTVVICNMGHPSRAGEVEVVRDALNGHLEVVRMPKGAKLDGGDVLFFDDVFVPAENVLGGEEGKGFYQLMGELPQERLIIAMGAMSTIERALEETIAFTKERKAFGKTIWDFQNTQFTLAELKARATAAKVFVNHCIAQHLEGKLDVPTACMAKLWLTELQGEVVDKCLQLHGGSGYINDYPIARMFRDSRVTRIFGGSNEIMKMVIARGM